MSTIKTATTALTAALLLTGIGLAVAQTEDVQRADPPTEAAATTAAVPLSEQTPADPNAVILDAAPTAQQQPVDQVTPVMPAETPAALPATDQTLPAIPAGSRDVTYDSNNTSSTTDTPVVQKSYEPAPRADRN